MQDGRWGEGKEEEGHFIDFAARIISKHMNTFLLCAVDMPMTRDGVLALGRNVPWGCLNAVPPQFCGWCQCEANNIEESTLLHPIYLLSRLTGGSHSIEHTACWGPVGQSPEPSNTPAVPLQWSVGLPGVSCLYSKTPLSRLYFLSSVDKVFNVKYANKI